MKRFMKLAVRLKKDGLLVATIVSVCLGGVLGFCLRSTKPTPRTVMLLNFPGEILMRMLKMLILPLIVSSLISGLAQLDAKQSSRMGSLAVGYYLLTTVIAVITGIIMVLVIHPGDPSIREDPVTGFSSKKMSTVDAFLDLIRNMFPENIIQATFEHVHTVEKVVRPSIKALKKNDSATVALLANGAYDFTKPVVEYTSGINVLGIIVFSIALGIMISQLGEEARVLIDFFNVLDMVIMRLVSYVMWYSPIGIMCLIMGKILGIVDLAETGRMLAMYMATVLTGLAVHSLVSLPLLYFLVTKQNPFVFMRGLLHAWVTALGTASSSATLPMTYRCLEDNLGVDTRVTRFVLPVGATINMDGTALYEAVAAIFIAQMNGISLTMGQVVTVSLTSTLASIGAASVPSAGLVTLLLVLTAVGLPVEDVSLIVAVDWLLDRVRTSINVLGDAFGAGIVNHLTKEKLPPKVDVEVATFGGQQRFSIITEDNGSSTPQTIIVRPAISSIRRSRRCYSTRIRVGVQEAQGLLQDNEGYDSSRLSVRTMHGSEDGKINAACNGNGSAPDTSKLNVRNVTSLPLQ